MLSTIQILYEKRVAAFFVKPFYYLFPVIIALACRQKYIKEAVCLRNYKFKKTTFSFYMVNHYTLNVGLVVSVDS